MARPFPVFGNDKRSGRAKALPLLLSGKKGWYKEQYSCTQIGDYDFDRSTLRFYDKDGNDITAEYNLSGGRIA